MRISLFILLNSTWHKKLIVNIKIIDFALSFNTVQNRKNTREGVFNLGLHQLPTLKQGAFLMPASQPAL